MTTKYYELSFREKRLRKRIKELSTLYEISKLLTSAMELDDVLDLIVEITAKTVGVKACGVRLLDEKTGEMVLKAVYGLSQEYILKGRIFAWKGVYRDVISKGQVAIVYDVATDPRFEYTDEAIEEGIKSMLSVGLLINGQPIGALSVYTDRLHHFTKDQVQLFKGIANEASVVIEKAMLYQERMENQRIEQELAAAAKIQANLMPHEIPQIQHLQIAAKNVPSQMIGGDFYDFIPFSDTHLGIVIADVSGKGIPGAILMASTRASLRAYLEEPHFVKEAMSRLNRVLFRETQSDQFVTLFYGMLDTQDKTFTYTNAGHNPPILFRNSEKILLNKGGLILGAFPEVSYEEEVISLLEGDLLLFYTDGITESQNDQDEYFGVEGISRIVENNRSKSSGEIMDAILDEVSNFNAGSSMNDDTTIMVLNYSEMIVHNISDVILS